MCLHSWMTLNDEIKFQIYFVCFLFPSFFKIQRDMVLGHNSDRDNPDRTQPGQTQPGQTQPGQGRNLDRTQPGQTQPGQGHNPDRDVTRTGRNPDRDTTRTQTDSVFNPDTKKIISVCQF